MISAEQLDEWERAGLNACEAIAPLIAEVRRLRAAYNKLEGEAALNEVRTQSLTAVTRERDAAKAKAAQYEQDWYAAKHEFGDNMAKARDALRAVTRERDALRVVLESVRDCKTACTACHHHCVRALAKLDEVKP